MDKKEIKRQAHNLALQCAKKYKIAFPKLVLDYLLKKYPDLNENKKEILAIAFEECKKVNKLTDEKINKKIEETFMDEDQELKMAIKIEIIKNALEYSKADPTKIVGKIISKFPNKKNQIKQIMQIAIEQAKEINQLSKEELNQIAKDLNVQITKKESRLEQPQKIKLPNAEYGKVITRFPPEPSGYLHIGHAKAIFLDYLAAKEYGGKMLLRFDDTNPEKEKQEYVDKILQELNWLGIKIDQEPTYSSDYMIRFYEFAKKMIKKQKAYVCNCDPEKIKENRIKKIECECRKKSIEQNLEEFEKMISGQYQEGEVVLRYVGDMNSENTTLRDPTLFRIIKSPHYRQKEKYSCWPSYDFCAPIVDSIEGVTHAMRSKEYELRDELYFSILDCLELRKPILISFSRLAIKGMPVSKRLINPLIEQKKVSGYDDPRLPTLAALRRRGILPKAIEEFVTSFGLTKVESEPNLDKLLSINKKLIDPSAKRRFFVSFPYAILKLKNKARNLEIKNHPTNELGKRTLKIKENATIYIPLLDAANLSEGEVFRLKDFCSLKVKKKTPTKIEFFDKKADSYILEVEEIELENVEKKIQWVDEANSTKVEVLVAKELFIDEKYNENSLEVIEGFAEKEVLNDNLKERFQFERFGFVILDKKYTDKLSYIFICK